MSHPERPPLPPQRPVIRTATHLARGTAILGTLLLAACAGESPVAPAWSAPRANSSVVEPTSGPWSRIVTGETGPGSTYAVYVPQTWNGDLVTIAHGFRDAALPVGLNEESYVIATREALGAQGYAVAYSSYSENGFAVKDGTERTHQLAGLATAQLGGRPRRHFLVGFSLGGAVALSLAESHPTQYDGALLACGMVGGSLTQTQYLGHARTLFDAAYPGVLQGTVLGVPANYVVNPGTLAGVIAGSPLNAAKAFAIASTRQAPLPHAPGNIPQIIESLITAVSFHARGINNITALVHGQSPFGNTGDVYTLGAATMLSPAVATGLIAQLDAAAARVEMSMAARQYLEHHYTPTGRIRIPVVSIHNRWDPVVPVFHEDSLAAAASRAGTSANLTQQRFDRFGHCNFAPAEVMGAFATMVSRSN